MVGTDGDAMIEFLKRLLSRGRRMSAATGEEEPTLTQQFVLTLRSSFLKHRPENPTEQQRCCVDQIERLLQSSDELSWWKAYEIEQLMIWLYDEETLDVELRRRIIEARRNLLEDYGSYYSELSQMSVERQRAMLSRVINDLQWRYSVEELKLKYSRITTSNTVWMFMAAVVLFAACFYWYVKDGKALGDLATVALAGLCGLWGACFSMITGLQQRLSRSSFETIKILRRVYFTVSRAFVGLGGGMILYFLFYAGVISGSAFPQLDRRLSLGEADSVIDVVKVVLEKERAGPGGDQAIDSFCRDLKVYLLSSESSDSGVDAFLRDRARGIESLSADAGTAEGSLLARLNHAVREVVRVDYKSLALLIVWCFLAGFSEKLVPNLLARTRAEAPLPRGEVPRQSEAAGGGLPETSDAARSPEAPGGTMTKARPGASGEKQN